MRRPLPVAVAAAALLVALGMPFLSIRFTGVDAGVLPEQASSRWSTRRPPRLRAAALTPAYAVVRRRRGGALRTPPRPAPARSGARPPPRRLGPETWEVQASSGATFLTERSQRLVRGCVSYGAAHSSAERRRSSSTSGTRSARASRSRSRCCACHLCAALPGDPFGRAALQGARHECADALGDVRDPRARLPGRPLRGPALVPGSGRAPARDAGAALRDRVRARDRLRGVPADADQGGLG